VRCVGHREPHEQREVVGGVSADPQLLSGGKITRSENKLTFWIAYSGPTPGRELGDYALHDLQVRSLGRRWDSISLDGVGLWTRAGDRPTVAAWRGQAT
jgi:hypothetical protein